MKVFCALLVFLAVFEASQAKYVASRKFTERLSIRTPFYKRQRPSVNPTIVNGQPADIADFPHHLGLADLTFGGYICGAANISPLWALSAAHCLEFGTLPHNINLLGGSTSRIGGPLFQITEYINHPQYNTNTLNNDVSIIRVHPDTPLTGLHVTPIALPPSCAAACCSVCVPGSDITVTGWGLNENGVIPVNLVQVSKPIFDQAQCNAFWGGITAQMFCTAVFNGQDSCNGDSGGPIIRDGILVGLVSFGSEVCGSGPPAVYVRLEAPVIRNWITSFTNF